MSRYRALALRVSLAAVMAATMGAATLTPGTASAAPDTTAATQATNAYPPTPPKLTVNHGRVKPGKTVRVMGKRFRSREKVTIIVRFKPRGSSKYRTVKQRDIRADRKGKFTITLRLARAGTVSIKGRGHSSHLSSTATVIVTKGKSRGTWVIRLAAFTPGAPVVKPASVVTAGHESSPVTGLAVAGLGAMALIGSAITFRVVRRRRRAGASA